MALKKIKLPDNSVVEVQDSRISGVDSTPVSGSTNIITSGGVYSSLAGKQDVIEIRYSQTEDVSEYNIAVLEALLKGMSGTAGLYPLIITMDGAVIAEYAIQYVERINSGTYDIGVTTMHESGFLVFYKLKIVDGVYAGFDSLGESLTAFWIIGLNYGSEGEEHTVTGTVQNITQYSSINDSVYYFIAGYGLSYGYNKTSQYYEEFFDSSEKTLRLRVYSDGHITTTWNNKANYYKPSTGIPVSDIASTSIDSSPTDNSTNLVTSGGVYDALADSRVTGKIFRGTCSTAAATAAKEVVCPEFTSADFEKVGTVIFVTFDHTNTGAVGSLTLNVNGTGALSIKKIYSASTANLTNAGELRGTMTYPFCRTGSYWMCMGLDYNTNNDTLAYQIRNNTSSRAASDAFVQYRLLFSSADDTKWVPANTSTSTNATAERAVNQTPINPFGPIVYYSSTTAIAAGSRPGPTSTFTRYPSYVLGYSFNRTGAALTLTAWKPVYLKCAPQADGSAIMDADQPIVQAFPTTADGKIYIFLGVAYDATHIEFYETHPIYYYRNGTIKLWTNDAVSPDVTVTKQNDQEFTARTTGNGVVGDASIGKISKILGKSLAWNQLIVNGDFSDGTTGWYSRQSGGLVVTDGVASFIRKHDGYNNSFSIAFPFIKSHKFYVAANVKANIAFNISIGGTKDMGVPLKNILPYSTSTDFVRQSTIISETDAYAFIGAGGIYTGLSVDDVIAEIDYIQVINLTLMFGAGNEPATVEEFERLYPLEYYGYNAGTLINNAATALKTTGFNLLDVDPIFSQFNGWEKQGDEWYIPSGKTRINDLIWENTSGYRGRMCCSLSVKYSGTSGQGQRLKFVYTDGSTSGGFPGTSTSYTRITMLSTAGKVVAGLMTEYGTSTLATYFKDINLNLNCADNGKYEPYWLSQLPLNLTSITGKLNGEGSSVTIFPDGLKSVGNVCDEIVGNKAIRRVGSVDLGTLTWALSSNEYFYADSVTGMRTVYATNAHENLLCVKYCAGVYNTFANVPIADKEMRVYGDNRLYIKDSVYANETDFKTAMSGVLLYYELATPEEYTLDEPLSLGYKCDGRGTEERLPADTASSVLAPFRADIQYGLSEGELIDDVKNYVDNIVGDIETLLAAI